jgi:hypothetical protein
MAAKVTFGLFVALLLGSAAAWHGNGHYLVAHIAQTYLIQNNQEALNWALKLLEPYKDMCGEDLYPFVESATWSDKIKDQNWHIFDNHHFISNFWFDKGAVPRNMDNNSYANIVFAIADNVNTLSSVKEDPYGSSKSLLGKSLSLRTMIHYFGDIHQPLHAEERVTPDRPNGDMGGNLFKIKHYNQSAIDNLHFIWDEMFEDYSTSIRSNLNKTQYAFIDSLSKSIQQEYPYDTLKAQISQNKTQKAWGLESFDIGHNFAYQNIEENKELPQSYQDEGRRICRQRVALAGYRLGMTLDQIHRHINSRDKKNLPAYLAGITQFMYEAKKKVEAPIQTKSTEKLISS